MQRIGHLTHFAAEPVQPEESRLDRSIVNLFLVLQGSYGSLFLSKYSSGLKDDKGHDKGMRATMKVWAATLSDFASDVIEQAARRVMVEFAEFPPNLPQFVAICKAETPVKTYAQEQGWKALPAPVIEPIKVDLAMQNDGKDWARRILYRAERCDKSVSRYALREARVAMKLEGKQAWQ